MGDSNKFQILICKRQFLGIAAKKVCDIRARRKKSVAKKKARRQKSVATKKRKYNNFRTLTKLMQRQVNKKQSGKPVITTKRKYF
jgi:hypothetical protein